MRQYAARAAERVLAVAPRPLLPLSTLELELSAAAAAAAASAERTLGGKGRVRGVAAKGAEAWAGRRTEGVSRVHLAWVKAARAVLARAERELDVEDAP